VGELAEVSAVAANLNDQVTVIESGEIVDNHLAGQWAFAGRFTDGALASVSLHGGNAPSPDGFLLRIAGTEGTLTVTPTRPSEYVGWAEWRVRVAPVDAIAEDLPVPDHYRVVPAGVPAGPVANIAALYHEIAQAIAEGRQAHPNFHTALRHQRTLAAIEQAAQTGVRQHIGEVTAPCEY